MGPLTVNLRRLDKQDLRLQGLLGSAELELDGLDPLIRVAEPVEYDLEVQKLDRSVLVRGRVGLRLECQCVRCLKTFRQQIEVAGLAWDLPWPQAGASGSSDFVDLTPHLREDTLLAFPQHPLCEPGCAGLKRAPAPGTEAQPGHESQMTSSVWAALNELEL